MTGFDLNMQFSLSLAISIFMNSLNFMLSRVEHEKKFYNLGARVNRGTHF